ncbi:hypothetical protein VTN00DRAFT_2824 [Thermoascus crustaceus]|uniref:uncharacterized protein n=1 Tax=Thermoascus crustaceus TaxID=5088 RepID=UPI003743EB9A
MEAPELHGGGAAHASTPAIGYVASQSTEIQELPDTSTPSRWTQQGPSRPSTDENYLNLAQASQKNSLGGAGAYRDGIASSLTSRVQNIIKQQQASKRPLGHRGPYWALLTDISKQFQALAGAIEQQAKSQQQAHQGELDIIWTQMTEQLNSWKAEQQIEKEHLLARISTLELEVSKLQTELNQAQQALKTSTPAQSETAHRPANRAAGDATAKKAPKDALKAGEASRPKESMKQPPKKGASYADIAALLATKPGGQEWQTVPARPSKTQKMEGHRGSKKPVEEAIKAWKPGSFTPGEGEKQEGAQAPILERRRSGGSQSREGGELAWEEIELRTEFQLRQNPIWLQNPQKLRGSEQKGSTIVIIVGSLEEA